MVLKCYFLFKVNLKKYFNSKCFEFPSVPYIFPSVDILQDTVDHFRLPIWIGRISIAVHEVAFIKNKSVSRIQNAFLFQCTIFILF